MSNLADSLARTIRARVLYQGAHRVGADRPETAQNASQSKNLGWHDLRDAALGCKKCGLCESRQTVVFGEGNVTADLMFVGEAPGADEDRTGRPFIGRAGELLTRMIEGGMGFSRDDVFIANVLKCRPPQNRDPSPEEVAACRPWLLRQIEIVQPKVICTLGRHALRALTGYEGGISAARGRVMKFPGALEGVQILPTFHPAYLLRNPAAKREAWEDLKTVLRLLGRPVSNRGTRSRPDRA